MKIIQIYKRSFIYAISVIHDTIFSQITIEIPPSPTTEEKKSFQTKINSILTSFVAPW